jgi:hypothetical protein
MPGANDNAVYNARILHMDASSSWFRHAACFFTLLLMYVPMVVASEWRASEEQLARKIVAATGPGAVALDVMNKSSLSRSGVEEIRRALTSNLASLGVRLVNAEQAAGTVQVVLSENLREYVWVAEIHQGNSEASIVMVTAPRELSAGTDHPAIALTIRKTLLWTDDHRILDAALVSGSPQHMIVLEAESVALLKFQDGRWQQEQLLPVSHSHPWPRDLRGRLALRNDHLFDAYLPGVFCRSATAAPLALNCYESDDPWPLGTDQSRLNQSGLSQSGLSAFFTPTRNFFTGALSPGIEKQTNVKAFYSAAMLPREKYNLWILSTVDGQVHLLDGVTDQTVSKLGWGSDIASVRTGCGRGWQVLVSGNEDGVSDTVAAFEIADREPAVVSQPAAFNGPITALWAEADGTSAIAISRNTETGKYEAYRLSIVCGQ